jgi:Host cell surface-exposed lipoprotein
MNKKRIVIGGIGVVVGLGLISSCMGGGETAATDAQPQVTVTAEAQVTETPEPKVTETAEAPTYESLVTEAATLAFEDTTDDGDSWCSLAQADEDTFAGAIENLTAEIVVQTAMVRVGDMDSFDDDQVEDVYNEALSMCPKAEKEKKPEKEEKPEFPSREHENAVGSAESYNSWANMSKTGLIDQLEYEGFAPKVATWAVEYMEKNKMVNWKKNAVNSAASYQEWAHMSNQELIDQLEYEGFTREQAEYGAANY